jgi:heme oxygenase (biliverdin-IX-beta and delta-forming)
MRRMQGFGATVTIDGSPPEPQFSAMNDRPDSTKAEHVAIARDLIRSRDRAALSTALAEDGTPYGSLVSVAADEDGSPLLFISELSEHSKNLARETRAALLYAAPESDVDPLTQPRVTAMGRMVRTDDAAQIARYVARHPEAERYRAFRDFHLWRMTVERAHLVAGFGAIRWLSASDVIGPA